ncbi:hypothetical protein E4U53_001069 [Claviceps sorghi]|nr:hypothetical protein E4U53_001069 [Claviceps sorghi]
MLESSGFTANGQGPHTSPAGVARAPSACQQGGKAVGSSCIETRDQRQRQRPQTKPQNCMHSITTRHPASTASSLTTASSPSCANRPAIDDAGLSRSLSLSTSPGLSQRAFRVVTRLVTDRDLGMTFCRFTPSASCPQTIDIGTMVRSMGKRGEIKPTVNPIGPVADGPTLGTGGSRSVDGADLKETQI